MNDLDEALDEDQIQLINEVIKSTVICSECTFSNEINTIEKMLVAYSQLIYCVVNHQNVFVVDISKVFRLEFFLLKFVSEPEILDVKSVLQGKYSKLEKIKDKFSICSEKYYQNSFSELNCEQCIESLTYKVFLKIRKNLQNINDKTQVVSKNNYNSFDSNTSLEDLNLLQKKNIEYTLLVLYLRKEYFRFFKIYNNIERSEFINRLAYILSLNDDCEYNSIDEKSFILHNIEIEDSILKENICLENEDKEIWKLNVNAIYGWNDKVRLWMKNREECSGILDMTMIDECINNRKYDEGWLIYTLGNGHIKEEFHRLSMLCITALCKGEDDIWAVRLINIIKSAIDKHEVSICCDLVNDIFNKIANIPEKLRFIIIREFIYRIRVMENDEKIVTLIIKGINELCKKCKNTETCDICVQHANMVYKEWKKNNTGGIFFKSHSKYENEIYENMLDMCDTIQDCSGFMNVCKDLIDNEAKINRSIYKKLQSIHNKTCKDCNDTKCTVTKFRNERQLLYHLLIEFKF